MLQSTGDLSALFYFSFSDSTALAGLGILILEASRAHWIRQTTLSRPPLNEWPTRRRDLYLTTHNTQNLHFIIYIYDFIILHIYIFLQLQRYT
jgi:hypothetical protein